MHPTISKIFLAQFKLKYRTVKFKLNYRTVRALFGYVKNLIFHAALTRSIIPGTQAEIANEE